jgi:DNA-binding SARP family transcriptional activator
VIVQRSFLTVSAFGPLGVRVDGRQRTVRGKPATMLALLACFPGETVSHRRVVDALWDPAAPPFDERRAVRQVLRRLDPVVPAGSITTTEDGGYRLETARTSIDVATCRILLRSGDHDQLRAALLLWSSDPFPELAHVPDAQIALGVLEAARLDAIETLCEAQLRRGSDYRLVAELERLVTLHPERERLWQLLALALHRCSRRLDALRTIDRCRSARAGAPVGPTTRRIERALLLDELDLAG